MRQSRERLPNHPSTHNISGVHLIRMGLCSFSPVANLTSEIPPPTLIFSCCFKVCFTTGYLTSPICSRKAHTQASVQRRRTQTAGQEQEQTAGQAGGSRFIQHLHQRHHQAIASCAQKLRNTFQPSLSENTEKHWTLLDYPFQNSYVILSQVSLLQLKSLHKNNLRVAINNTINKII